MTQRTFAHLVKPKSVSKKALKEQKPKQSIWDVLAQNMGKEKSWTR